MRYWIVLVLALGIASCNTPEKLITKSWKVDDVVFTDPNNDGFSDAVKAQIKDQLVKDFRFTFAKDSIYMVKSANTELKGLWWLSPDKKQFTTKSATDQNTSNIIELKKDRLVFGITDIAGHKMQFTCSPILLQK